MERDESDRNSSSTASPPGEQDESYSTVKSERRKRYPGILSKVASGSPEDTAIAVLKGELALHGTGLRSFDKDRSSRNGEKLGTLLENGKD